MRWLSTVIDRSVQSAFLERKKCVTCGKRVPDWSQVGDTCPHCGRVWTKLVTEAGSIGPLSGGLADAVAAAQRQHFLDRKNALIKRVKWALRVFCAAVVLGAIAAAGFFLRPLSYFNAALYLLERIQGIESRTVEVGGHRVHYLAEGPTNGPAVVLVHGLGARAEDWSALAPYLARAGFRVYIPELVGYGRSDRPRDFSYSVHDEAEVVVGFMDALGLKQVELGGWSMGGWVAVIAAAEHPERVSRLMLFDAAGLKVNPEYDTALFVPSNVDQLHQLQVLLSPRAGRIPAFVARDILRGFRRDGWVIQRALASMLTGRDVIDSDLPQLKMPVLLAWGELDRITPLSQGEAMHRLIPHADLEVIPGCGHMAPIECSAAVGPKVVAFARQ